MINHKNKRIQQVIFHTFQSIPLLTCGGNGGRGNSGTQY